MVCEAVGLYKLVDRLLEIAPHPTPDVPPLLQQVPGKLLWQSVGVCAVWSCPEISARERRLVAFLWTYIRPVSRYLLLRPRVSGRNSTAGIHLSSTL